MIIKATIYFLMPSHCSRGRTFQRVLITCNKFRVYSNEIIEQTIFKINNIHKKPVQEFGGRNILFGGSEKIQGLSQRESKHLRDL